MKSIKIAINRRLMFEFVSIAFAVFLGLMLNQWKENRSNNKLAEQSIDNMRMEIIDNNARVKVMLDTHRRLVKIIDSLLVHSEIEDQEEDVELDLNFEILSSTSWETAKLTQAIVYMDIETVTDIADIYKFQNYYEAVVRNFVLNNIYVNRSKNDREFRESLKRLLEAIIPMEESLLEYYSYMTTNVLVDN